MLNNLSLKNIHIILTIAGLAVIIGALISGKHSAIIVGVIVAAVNIHQLRYRIKKENEPID